jgi:DNA-binding CsgD family transcriptional regulator
VGSGMWTSIARTGAAPPSQHSGKSRPVFAGAMEVGHHRLVGTMRRQGLADRIGDAAGRCRNLPALAEAVCAAIAQDISFDFGCFATLDPATGLISWAYRTRPLGVGDEEIAAGEYGEADINSFAEISQRRPSVGVLSIDTAGRLDTCRRYRDLLRPRFGFSDELRMVFNSRGASWGALAIYRAEGDPAFTMADARKLAASGELVATAIQRVLFGWDADQSLSGAAGRTVADADGPAVLIIDADDHVTHLSPAARSSVEDMGGWEHGSLPTGILAVAASTRHHQEHSSARVQGRSGRWLNVRAAPLDGPAGKGDVVVTLEPATGAELSRLALTARGLTAREKDVATLVLQGASTRAISSELHLSPHTVQDHLKAIFAKLGVNSRREMIARFILD